MALSVGLGGNLTANATASISAALLEQAGASGYHPTCGLASCRHILQGLTVANASAALFMATIESSPSWGYMVSPFMPGTIWEAWGGDAHDSDGKQKEGCCDAPLLTTLWPRLQAPRTTPCSVAALACGCMTMPSVFA